MKKTYKNPILNVVKIKTPVLMLTASGAEGLTTGEDWSSGSANARDFDFDDDEE